MTFLTISLMIILTIPNYFQLRRRNKFKNCLLKDWQEIQQNIHVFFIRVNDYMIISDLYIYSFDLEVQSIRAGFQFTSSFSLNHKGISLPADSESSELPITLRPGKTHKSPLIQGLLLTTGRISFSMYSMAIWVVEFSNGGYKIRKVFA